MKDNSWHIFASTDSGEVRLYSFLPKEQAFKLATAYQEIEDYRRSISDNPVLRDMPEAFDSYYIKNENTKKCLHVVQPFTRIYNKLEDFEDIE